MEAQQAIVNTGFFYFARKPLLVKPWNPELDLHTEQLTSLPIWVQFQGLDLKYWGMDSLGKIGSILGIPIKTDRYTMDKRFLRYARLLIDMPLNDPFPEFVEFVNDQDVLVRIPVHYEWKPLKCSHCHMYGHLEPECRKKHPPQPTKQVWRPISTSAPKALPDDEGFVPVSVGARPSPRPRAEAPPTTISNPFEVLEQAGEHLGNINSTPILEAPPPNGRH